MLTCDEEMIGLDGFPELEDGVCYIHDTKSPVEKMVGGLCHDMTIAKTSEAPMYCPFSVSDDAFMWINETLQQQDATDKTMLSK